MLDFSIVSVTTVIQQSGGVEEEEEEVDRLGALPDDVLLDILRRLELRTAFRTSAVSRRWRRLPQMLPILAMDVADLMPNEPSLHTRDQVMAACLRAKKICVETGNPEQQLALVLKNLKVAYLYNIRDDRNLDWTLFILEAAPSLETFYLELSHDRCGLNNETDATCSGDTPTWFEHRSLRLIQVSGFASRGKLMQYIRRVIARAVCLKRVRLLQRRPPAWVANQGQHRLIRKVLAAGLDTNVDIFIGTINDEMIL